MPKVFQKGSQWGEKKFFLMLSFEGEEKAKIWCAKFHPSSFY
jgi:hypothetical protein